MSNNKSRRSVIKNLLAGTASITAASSVKAFSQFNKKLSPLNILHGNINHAVCRWCFGFMSLEELCLAIREIGFDAIDLVGPKDWPTLKKYGVFSSMCNGAEINLVDGFAEKNFHATLIKNYTEIIPLVAKAGYKNLICFSGNRRGMDDETGLKNAAEGLKQIMSLAEKHKVIIQMELLNSKVDHKDYMCDRTPWGVELCKRVGSENFKLLYDIYHMQIDEGDVIRTIRDNHQYLGHYHTAGVPGRHELDEKQELYYPAIMKAIHATGFSGFVAQEFIPTGPTPEEKLAALKSAIYTCDV
jgi:hydroxypyruvate isomerase